ncbi:hypothetical protein SR870_07355 [Rhodopseudomonas palustris]|uniref:hypothetical protein n=1 Tax=Rhodopseudomonas palustris TaxID=1076 RepID=UPI002ACD4CCA|nr:hypothetical protein [Rhodopseudomonas palustris]WQH01082.1 hypothetical protein SR870_07355 [Rhodopseudomonas palustris]
MSQSTAKVLSAAGAGLVASLALTAVPDSAAHAGECLAGPKGPAPAGSHWFYRTDHTNKRKCWYVRATGEQSAKPADTASTDAAASGTNTPADPTTAAAGPKASPKPVRTTAETLHPSIANARAEFESQPEPAPMREAAEPAQASQFPAPLPAITSSSTPQNSAQTGDQPSAGRGSPIDQRWSDATTIDASPASTADASSKLRTAAQSAAAKGATPAAAALSASGSASTLIAALLAALALAGLIVGGIVKFGRREPVVRRDPNGRPDIWRDAPRSAAADDVAAEHSALDVDPSPPTQPAEPPAWIKAARQRQTEVKSTDEIEELLARAQKRPAA